MTIAEIPDQKLIEEIKKVNAFTDRVKRRKEELMAATPHLSAERSRCITDSWRETEGDVLPVRMAKGFKKVMEGNPVAIHKGELIVGSQSGYVRGASPGVEWSPDYTFELFEGGKLALSGLVLEAEVSEEDKKNLLEDARYWESRSLTTVELKLRHELFGEKMDDLVNSHLFILPSTRPTSSFVADWGKVINIGLNGIIAEAKDQVSARKYIDGVLNLKNKSAD